MLLSPAKIMNPYQLIDTLCSITSLLADIIRKQQSVIMQHGIEIDDPLMQEQLERSEEMLDTVEFDLRRL